MLKMTALPGKLLFVCVTIELTLSIGWARKTAESENFPFRNTSLPWDERVDDLVKRLTLEEMVLQMAYGGGNAGPCPAIERLGILPYNFNTECLRGVVAPNKATAFPQSIGLAATFRYDFIHASISMTRNTRIHDPSMLPNVNCVASRGKIPPHIP